MLILNTKRALLNMKGNPLENEDNKPVLLGVVLSNVLGGKTSNPARSWVLGKKFATEKVVELKAEDVVYVKQEVEKLGSSPTSWLSGLLCGQLLEILDGNEPEPTKEKTEAKESPKKK